MTNNVLLNNIDHKDLKINTSRSAKFGDDVMCIATYPLEFRNIQAHYPLFFQKDASTGAFQSVALLGFEKGENLFLKNNGWENAYIPMMLERQPFLIGFQETSIDGEKSKTTVIHVDVDSPRIDQVNGEAVFLEHGGNTPYLEKMAAILDAIHQGHESQKDFIDSLLEFELLESFTLDIELNDGSSNRLAGFYTVNESKLYELKGDALEKLNDKGYLQAIYMTIASLSNIKKLIDLKNLDNS